MSTSLATSQTPDRMQRLYDRLRVDGTILTPVRQPIACKRLFDSSSLTNRFEINSPLCTMVTGGLNFGRRDQWEPGCIHDTERYI
jgi:hypothetical protein